jgi:hypothetical protein
VTQYPQQYQTSYYAAQYQPLFWTAVLEGLIGVTVLAAMAAWAFSLVRKAFKGEEVEFPL